MTDKPPREAKARKGRAKKQRPPPKRGRNVVKGLIPEVVVTLTNAQERFCQLMAKRTLSNTACYMQAYPESSKEAARRSAYDLLTIPDIQARIEWYRAEARKNIIHSIEDSILWCKSVIETPVGDVDEESPLAQEVQRDEVQMGGSRGQLKRGNAECGNEEQSPEVVVTKVKVKLPSKMDAQKHLDALLGYTKADKELEKQSDALVDLVSWIRNGANVTPKAAS
jgi:hypothetical protein